MNTMRVTGFVLAWGAALLLTVTSQKVLAQVTHDPQDAVYATGVVFETAQELADKPRTPLYRNYLPPSVDLSGRFPRAGDQGVQGSCVGWAVGYAARSSYNSAAGGRWLRDDQIPSPAYIYDALRGPDDTLCENGTRISDALDLLMQGVASLADYAYQESLCRPPGATSTVPGSGRFRIASWLVVDVGRLDQVKAELAGGHPVMIGMRTNRRFDRLRGRKVWRAGTPRDGDGRHAVTVVGYSESGQYFVVMNSWGEGWGDRGFGRISYETFRKWVRVGYSMRLAETPPPTPPRPAPAPLPPPPPRPDVVSPEPDPSPPAPVVPALKLPVVGCGRMAVEQRGDQTFVVGFVGNREDLAKVTQAAEKSNAQSRVELRPWPQCEALMTLEKPLARPDKPSIALPKAVYRVGETLAFDVSMASFQGYVHVAYIQADGSVVNLVQSDSPTLSTLAAGSEMRFGDGREGRPRFTVSAPFGSEMMVAIASKSPLFAEDRPLVETEREFLTALRKAIIARPDPTLLERVVTASFAVLETTGGE